MSVEGANEPGIVGQLAFENAVEYVEDAALTAALKCFEAGTAVPLMPDHAARLAFVSVV